MTSLFTLRFRTLIAVGGGVTVSVLQLGRVGRPCVASYFWLFDPPVNVGKEVIAEITFPAPLASLQNQGIY